MDLQTTLIGTTVTLRPLQVDDFEALYKAASDPEIWAMHPDTSRYKRDVFEQRFFKSAIASGGALAVVENISGRLIGSSRYYEYDAEKSEISIGYTFLEPSHWGAGKNSEIKSLMLEHIFSYVGVVWFHVGKINLRSRKAVEKLGAILDYEKERELDSVPYVQLYYRLDKSSYLR